MNDAAAVVKVFCKWLEILEQNGLPFPHNAEQMDIVASHSALLVRMLSGKQPLPEAPPKRFGYPWYNLIENAGARPFEVSVPEEPDGMIVIDQHLWRVIQVLGPNEWIVAYQTPDTKQIAQALLHGMQLESQPMRDSATRWRVRAVGIQDANSSFPGRTAWEIGLEP